MGNTTTTQRGRSAPNLTRNTQVKRRKRISTSFELSEVCKLYLQCSKLELNGTVPSPRYAHTMAVVDDRIFIFGGYTGSFSDNHVYIYDTILNIFTQASTNGTPPISRAFHSCATVNSTIYFYGGYSNQNPLSDFFALDTKTMTWSYPPNQGNPPTPRFEHSITAVGSYLFLYGGGSTQTWPTSMHVYDTESNMWGVAPVTNKPIKGLCSNTFLTRDKDIFVFGGFDGQKRVNTCQWFSAEGARWEPILVSDGYKPEKRAAHASVMIGNKVLIHGGYNGKSRLNDFWMFDTVACRWVRPIINGSGPSARSYHSACVVNNKVYIFGGYDGQTRSNDMYVIEEVLPSLANLCVSFIRRNRSSVGSLSKLPIELQELVTGISTPRKGRR